jgi:pilin isopeptide linkage protein
MMKNLKKVLATALASVMVLGVFTTTAFADNAASSKAETPITEIPVSKVVEISLDSTIPDETFTFKMTPATTAQINSAKIGNMDVEVGPELKKDGVTDDTVTLTFGSSDDTSTASADDHTVSDVTKSTTFDLTKLTFTHTGIYRYYISEVTSSDTYITYDTHKYEVDLYVYDYDGTCKVGAYTLKRIDSAGVYDATKPESVSFENKVNVCDITIHKTVAGETYSQNEAFTFYIRIPAGGDTITLTAGQTIHAEIWNATGYVSDNDITVKRDLKKNDEGVVIEELDMTNSELAQSFTLHDGEYLKICGAPVSMIYYVCEADVTDEGYTQTYNYKESGTRQTTTAADVEGQKAITTTTTKDDSGNDVTVNTPVVIKGTTNTTINTVTFINTRYINVDSGINIDLTPYILVMVIAICGGLLFVIRKKRCAR